MNSDFFKVKFLILTAVIMLGLTIITQAQTTVFTYQGRFTDTTVTQPTNGTYEMQFKVFDAAAGGNQFDSTLTLPTVQVVNGIFTVTLDYGALTFRGQDIFLEIGVRPAGSAIPFTVLNPRQKFTSAPYAIQSFNSRNAVIANNSLNLGGIPADQYVTGQVVRSVNNLIDNVTLVAGSNISITPSGNTLTIASIGGNGINNQTSQQTTANFNIDGTGTANIFNATTQFNIGANRVLSVGNGNIFAGINSGTLTTGGDNTFVGTNSGMTNIVGFNNSFFGTDAGRSNTGANNSFFGRSSGFANTTGSDNSFFGLDAGRFNTTGTQNAFFGVEAGSKNIGGNNNTFSGGFAGFNNLSGADNSFFGLSSGFSNTIGSNNAFVGRSAGQNNSTGNTNSFFGSFAGTVNTIGSNNSALGNAADFSVNNLNFATAIGAGAVVSTSNTLVLGRNLDTVIAPNLLQVNVLGAAGVTSLCRNALNQISTCSAGGGGSFIDNSTVLQPTSNFNISGNGTVGGTLFANIINSATTYKIGGVNVFSTPNGSSVVIGGGSSNHTLSGLQSTFVGTQAGEFSNNQSSANTFIGYLAGRFNTSGKENTFVGNFAGNLNVTGSFTSFFGSFAGNNNLVDGSSFFGYQAGSSNGSGLRNSFFGFQAGQGNQSDNDNSFFGYNAGMNSFSGSGNSFFGSLAGGVNSTGDQNSFFGSSSGLANNSGGQNAFFGEKSGFINTTGTGNTFVGFRAGETTVSDSFNTALGYRSLAVVGNGNIAVGSGAVAAGGFSTTVGYNSFANGLDNTILGSNITVGGGTPVNHSTAIGADAVVTTSNTIMLGTNIDTVRVPKDIITTGTAKSNVVQVTGNMILTYLTPPILGDFPLCINTTGFVYRCGQFGNNVASSSENGKTNIENQKINGANESLVNSVKEQQIKIAAQAEQIKQQQIQIEQLKQTVCAINPAAAICAVK